MDKQSLSKRVDVIRHINSLPKKKKFLYVKNCEDECVHVICEALFNLLKGQYKLDSKKKYNLKQRLRPIRGEIRQLSDHKVAISTKKRLLSDPQVGGGVFNFLVSTALPALLSLI